MGHCCCYCCFRTAAFRCCQKAPDARHKVIDENKHSLPIKLDGSTGLLLCYKLKNTIKYQSIQYCTNAVCNLLGSLSTLFSMNRIQSSFGGCGPTITPFTESIQTCLLVSKPIRCLSWKFILLLYQAFWCGGREYAQG